MRARLRSALLIAIGALYLVSVPWYRETGSPVTFVWGLPDWVALALACYLGVAVLNGVAWLLTDMPEPEAAVEPPGPPSPRCCEPGDGDGAP
jgi:hypothetical protein